MWGFGLNSCCAGAAQLGCGRNTCRLHAPRDTSFQSNDSGTLMGLTGQEGHLERGADLDVVLRVAPLREYPAAPIFGLHSEHTRGAPHALLAADAG